jgi:pimeloyl-ACP methyl ester carboxylesterase
MSLNATIFPELGVPVVTPDLSGIDLGEDGVTSELVRDGFDVYVRLLENELKISPSWNDSRRVVVAHSFGGMLALHWLLGAGSKPPPVDGLVLIGSTAGPMYQRVSLRIPTPWGQHWRIGARNLVPIWNQQFITRGVKRLLCNGRLGAEHQDFRALGIKSDRELGLAGWRNTDWRAMRAFRYVMDGFDVRQRLREIATSTIVLHGTEDSLFSIEDAQILSKRMPNAELRLIQGAEHSLPITHGCEVLRAVHDLLDG